MNSDARYDELERLAGLRDRGVITEQEFADRKQLLLSQPERRPAGVAQRTLAAILWTIVFWFGGLFLAGAVAGVMDPPNASEAGRQAGENLSGPLFLLALAAAIAGVATRKLPLTR